jgi:hypothetical protein
VQVQPFLAEPKPAPSGSVQHSSAPAPEPSGSGSLGSGSGVHQVHQVYSKNKGSKYINKVIRNPLQSLGQFQAMPQCEPVASHPCKLL